MKKTICLVALLVCPSMAFSEPSKPIQYLMNDNVSMLDYGAGELQEGLQCHIKKWCADKERNLCRAEFDGIGVEYLYSDNRIKISLAFTTKGLTKGKLKTPCKEGVELVRSFLYVKDGKVTLMKTECSPLQLFFGNRGYQCKKLDNITVIEVYVQDLASNKFLNCEAPLLDTKISFVKQE